MNTCRTISLLLAGHAAHELSELEHRRVEVHLFACRACRDELAKERHLREALGLLPPISCPDRVTDSIKEAVDRDQRRRGVLSLARTRTLTAAVLSAARLAAAALLLFFVLPSGNDEPAPRQAAITPAVLDGGPTRADIDQARHDLTRGLAFMTAVIDRTERRVRSDVLRILQPAIQAAAGRETDPTFPGGQG